MQTEIKTKTSVFLLALIVGMFGIHRFYVGKRGTGVAILLLSISMVGTFIATVWVFIDLALILTDNFSDSQGRKITKW